VRRETKLWLALAIYGGLGVLEWLTLGGKIRLAALLILAFFVIRTLVHDRRTALQERDERQEPANERE
jgi:hypothetical protein